MAGREFIRPPDVDDDMPVVLLHHFLCFILRDLRITADHTVAVHDLGTGRAGGKQQEKCRHNDKNPLSLAHLQILHIHTPESVLQQKLCGHARSIH